MGRRASKGVWRGAHWLISSLSSEGGGRERRPGVDRMAQEPTGPSVLCLSIYVSICLSVCLCLSLSVPLSALRHYNNNFIRIECDCIQYIIPC